MTTNDASTLWVLAAQADAVPAAERERFKASTARHLDRHPDWVILHTCHRTELYGFGEMPHPGVTLPPMEGLRILTGCDAARRLCRVAAGLESAVLGEDEVLHQVRVALAQARGARLVDPRLGRLFEVAISAGRAARAGRSRNPGNLAERAVAWLRTRTLLMDRPALVVGAGTMGSALAQSLSRRGARLKVASRHRARAERLARLHEGNGVELTQAARLAPHCAAVAIALAGPWEASSTIDELLPPTADLSSPSALPARQRAALQGNFLGIDELFELDVRGQGPERTAYLQQAHRLVEAATQKYVAWLADRSSHRMLSPLLVSEL